MDLQRVWCKIQVIYMSRFKKKKKENQPIFFRYQDCIAKSTSDGSPGLSVYKHCQYAGKISAGLIGRMPSSFAELFPYGSITLVSLHDIGKVSPGFQKKINPNSKKLQSITNAGLESNHAEIGEASFISWIKKKQEYESSLEDWGICIGSHHGKRKIPYPDSTAKYGGYQWQKERYNLMKRLIDEFGDLPITPPLSDEQLYIISGLVCIADWIASDEDYFPSVGLSTKTDLNLYVPEVLRNCGWIRPEIRKGLTFEDVFSGFKPYPVQKEFIDTISEPGLYILEAPMGSGKTEAALYTAYKLMSSGQNCGIYFGLPTRLSSNKIHTRVSDFLNKIVVNDTQCRLIHGQAWLELGGGKELETGKSWFNPVKRAILAPFGVGTIDQALLSVLNARHFFVRSFGLANKVVILDEVHSYDVYTGTLLDKLIESLLNMDCSVIVLSATLTHDRKKTFFRCPNPPVCEKYPLITTQPKEKTISFLAPEFSETKEVDVKIISNDIIKSAIIAVEKARLGMCVLWIANTVAESQKYYKVVCSEKTQGDYFRIGLLHSRFPAFRRSELENDWIESLGKNGNRPKGCILIATQIVEQSVDIDADFMISDLAPTDMILQRLGRLWRHARQKRPAEKPEILIRCGEIGHAQSEDELEEVMGKSRYVYAPYVLWRSYQIWKKLKAIILPRDIRKLLEATYQHMVNEPDFILKLKEKLESKKNELREKALGSTSHALPSMPDDEYVVTRYSTLVQIQALLVLSLDSTGNTAKIKLLSGEVIEVDSNKRNFYFTKLLHKNIVPLNKYYFHYINNFRSYKYLARHIYGDILILEWQNDGSLLAIADNPTKTPLFYDDNKGIYQDKQQLDINNSFKGEFNDEFDW